MNSDLIKFKHVLEYFVAHLNYIQSKHSTVKGYEEYIKPFIDSHSFRNTGQGWNDGLIQKQIEKWENIASHKLCINVQPNYGAGYTTRKCYLNWIHTGINIFCDWENGEIVYLSIGYCYWWLKSKYKIVLKQTISELGLFYNDHDETILSKFYNRFVKEIYDFDNHMGDYYNEYAEYNNKMKQQKIMNDIRPYTKILTSNYNMILTGAPGTGKTYLAKQIAQLMIFGEIKQTMSDDDQKQFNEQFGFVQFHPNYDYTDFVEGLRPIQDENGNIGFERRDGVFKSFCKKALVPIKTNITDNFNTAWGKMILAIRDNLSEGKLTKIGKWEYSLSTKETLKYSSQNTASQYSFTITKDNVYNAYCGKKARESGAYQKDMLDIVEYLKKYFGLSENIVIDGKKADKRNYVFVIDEINRGETSKIFGELFYSIDSGYRGINGKLKTQYQNLIEADDEFYNGFYIPENVYIIGTMNDIDRSVESMDFAMRRRFAFKEILAADTMDMIKSKEKLVNDYSQIEERMKNLNQCILTIQGFSTAYQIGAAYFLKLENYLDEGKITDKSWEYLWNNHLQGLLFEYLRGASNADEDLKKLKKAYSLEDRYENVNGKIIKKGNSSAKTDE